MFGQSRTNAHLDAKDSPFEEFISGGMDISHIRPLPQKTSGQNKIRAERRNASHENVPRFRGWTILPMSVLESILS